MAEPITNEQLAHWIENGHDPSDEQQRESDFDALANEVLALRRSLVDAYIGGHFDASVGPYLAKYLGSQFDSFLVPAEMAVAARAYADTDVRDGVERRLREIGIVR